VEFDPANTSSQWTHMKSDRKYEVCDRSAEEVCTWYDVSEHAGSILKTVSASIIRADVMNGITACICTCSWLSEPRFRPEGFKS
jgi:hypothetical protein